MRQRRQFSVWFPIAVAFAVAATVTGFGLDAILSSPGAVLYAAFVLAVLLLPGSIIGGVAVAATRVADRTTTFAVPTARRASIAGTHAASAGLLAGLLTWAYLASTPPRSGHFLAPTAVAIVAAIVAGREAVKADRLDDHAP